MQDVNRQTWAANTSLLVHPASVYVGIKTPRTFVQKGEKMEIESIVSDLDGKLVTGTIRFEKMTMRSDLNRPITGIGNDHLNRLTALERHNVAFPEDDLTRNHGSGLNRNLLDIPTHTPSLRHFLLGFGFLLHRFTYQAAETLCGRA